MSSETRLGLIMAIFKVDLEKFYSGDFLSFNEQTLKK